jgi:excisionase family DNA binding protein
VTYFKVPEVAKMLRLRRDTVTGLIRRGELAAFNVGSGGRAQYRVSQQALDEFVQARAVKPPKVALRRRQRQSVPDYFA